MEFEEFAKLSDQVMYYLDLNKASEIDQEKQESRQKALNQVRGR